MVPHREYREGFLLHPLSAYPDGEGVDPEINQTTREL